MLFSNQTLDSSEFSWHRMAPPPRQVGDRRVMPLPDDEDDVFRLERENVGNSSFKFQEIPFTNESLWVVMRSHILCVLFLGICIYTCMHACK